MSDRAARLAEKREKLRLMREQKKQRKCVATIVCPPVVHTSPVYGCGF